jgi:hypothetical protein
MGLHPKFCQFVGFLYIIVFFFDFKPVFNGFCPILGDLEPDLRPYLGRKLGG